LGDEAGGYGIALSGLRAVLRAHDETGPATSLAEMMLSAMGLAKPESVVHWIYNRSRRTDEIAKLAEVVLHAADEGDLVALSIVVEAGASLARQVRAVARRLAWEGEVPVIGAGSLLTRVKILREHFLAHLRLPSAQFSIVPFPPVVGALLRASRDVPGLAEKLWEHPDVVRAGEGLVG